MVQLHELVGADGRLDVLMYASNVNLWEKDVLNTTKSSVTIS